MAATGRAAAAAGKSQLETWEKEERLRAGVGAGVRRGGVGERAEGEGEGGAAERAEVGEKAEEAEVKERARAGMWILGREGAVLGRGPKTARKCEGWGGARAGSGSVGLC